MSFSRIEAIHRSKKGWQGKQCYTRIFLERDTGYVAKRVEDVYLLHYSHDGETILNLQDIVEDRTKLKQWFNYYSHSSQDSYTTFMRQGKGLDNAAASRASILMKTGAGKFPRSILSSFGVRFETHLC